MHVFCVCCVCSPADHVQHFLGDGCMPAPACPVCGQDACALCVLCLFHPQTMCSTFWGTDACLRLRVLCVVRMHVLCVCLLCLFHPQTMCSTFWGTDACL